MTEKAVKALQIIPKTDADKFMRKITLIVKNPYASLAFVKRLKNSQNFRFRFGNYRRVYNVNEKVLELFRNFSF
jgi:mRNA-degrading endonuclease RelE of RelBE toxin-antitoxin system